MGYNCYISKRVHWCDEGDDITINQWLNIIETDPSLSRDQKNGDYFAIWQDTATAEFYWLDWNEGNIYSKNPPQSLRIKMHAIANTLNARLIGDDGESYAENGLAIAEKNRIASCLAAFMRRLKHAVSKKMIPVQSIPFNTGDKVKDIWGNEATVTKVDPYAEHGMGLITIKYPSGQETSISLITPGLTKLDE